LSGLGARSGALADKAETFMAAYGAKPGGNASTGSAHGFEGKNILEFVGDLEDYSFLIEGLLELYKTRAVMSIPLVKQCCSLCWRQIDR